LRWEPTMRLEAHSHLHVEVPAHHEMLPSNTEEGNSITACRLLLRSVAWPGPPRAGCPCALPPGHGRRARSSPLRASQPPPCAWPAQPRHLQGEMEHGDMADGEAAPPRLQRGEPFMCGRWWRAGSAARNSGRSSLTRCHVLERKFCVARSGMATRVPRAAGLGRTCAVAWGSWRPGRRRKAVGIRCGACVVGDGKPGRGKPMARAPVSGVEDGAHFWKGGRRRAWLAGVARMA
jgi:hypothetical protein